MSNPKRLEVEVLGGYAAAYLMNRDGVEIVLSEWSGRRTLKEAISELEKLETFIAAVKAMLASEETEHHE